MNNLFKRGFASLALASAMTSSIFAGSAAHIDVKLGQVFASTENGKDGNVTAFKMHIKKGKIVATFDKGASHGDSVFIKLAVLSKKVAGDGIKGTKIVFKEVRASKLSLTPNQTDAKIGKLTFAINQTDEANLLIISAASKKDLENAMPFNVAVNRIGAKMHLAVTRDRIGLKSTLHLFTNNISWDQWNKEKVIIGEHTFKKQNAMNPQVNLYSDATESTTDKNMTNANLLMNSYGKGRIGAQANMKLDPNNEKWNNFGNPMLQVNMKLDPKSKIWKEYGKSMITAKAKTGMKLDSNNEKWNNFGNPMLQVNMKLDPKSKIWKEYGKSMITAKAKTGMKLDSTGKTIQFTATLDPEDAKILFNPHKHNVLGKSAFGSKTDYGALSASMAA